LVAGKSHSQGQINILTVAKEAFIKTTKSDEYISSIQSPRSTGAEDFSIIDQTRGPPPLSGAPS
jgi:hypothetical protein